MSEIDFEKLAASKTSVYARQIWNAAIDRAAKVVGYKDKGLAEIVQDLKK